MRLQVTILSAIAIFVLTLLPQTGAMLFEKKLMKAGAAWGVIGAGAAVPFIAPIIVAQQIYQGGENARYFPRTVRPVVLTRQIAL